MSLDDAFRDARVTLVDLFGNRTPGTVKCFGVDGFPAKFWTPNGTGYEMKKRGAAPEYHEIAEDQPEAQG